MMFLRFNCFEFMCSGKLKEGHFALFLGETLNSYLLQSLSLRVVIDHYQKTIGGGKLAQFQNPNLQKY